MADLASAVDQVANWPVGVAAAAAVGPNGVLAATGPVNRQFPLASVTKPLAVLSALVAVEEGAVELTDAADEDLVPGATIRHLMSHASGLAPDELKRMFPPAGRRVYSHVGIELLADLVARAVGMPFGSYFQEKRSFGRCSAFRPRRRDTPRARAASHFRNYRQMYRGPSAPPGSRAPAAGRPR